MPIPEPIEFARYNQRATPAAKPAPPARCSYAESFAGYCEALLVLLDKARPAEFAEAAERAKRQLLDRYCDFLTDTPVTHERRKHPCIVEELNRTIKEIRLRERSVKPAALRTPQPRRQRQTEEAQDNEHWLEEMMRKIAELPSL